MTERTDGFHPIRYKLDESSVTRYLFVKQHEPKEEDFKPSDRTLYVVSVPQFFKKHSLFHLFEEFGDIEDIFIHTKPTSTKEKPSKPTSHFIAKESMIGPKVAYIIFKDTTSIKNVLKPHPVKSVPLAGKWMGLCKWKWDYDLTFVNVKSLQEEINTFMENYDKTVAEERQKEKEMDGEPDEEGWVTVTKSSKKPKIPRVEGITNKLLAKQKRSQQKSSLLNFYKSQLRDAKMDQIVELRKKFEQDKAKIAQMKASRKFKPF